MESDDTVGSDNALGGEVARLRKQIELEIEAMQRGFSGYAMTASHDIINRRFETLGTYQEQLGRHVGEEAANLFVFETYNSKIG